MIYTTVVIAISIGTLILINKLIDAHTLFNCFKNFFFSTTSVIVYYLVLLPKTPVDFISY